MTRRRKPARPRRDLYQDITDRVLEILDRGTVPWRNPLRRQGGGCWPRNLTTDKRYRGINVFLLAITAWDQGFGSDYWLTFRQAKSLGGSVKKGEKSTLVTFWKLYEKTDASTGEEVTLPVLRHYHVFNAEQCEGIEAPDLFTAEPDAAPFVPIDECQRIVSGYVGGPEIEHRGGPARYLPASDKILIPAPGEYQTPEDYYAVLFHEAVHSTGHASRLNRRLDGPPAPFCSKDYGQEELVAEMGSAFLAAVGGISPPTIEQSAAYVESWKKAISADKRLVVVAAGAAQRAADWILEDRARGSERAGEGGGKDEPPGIASGVNSELRG